MVVAVALPGLALDGAGRWPLGAIEMVLILKRLKKAQKLYEFLRKLRKL